MRNKTQNNYLQMELLHCLKTRLNTQRKPKKNIGKKLFKNVIWWSSLLDWINYCNCETVKLH